MKSVVGSTYRARIITTALVWDSAEVMPHLEKWRLGGASSWGDRSQVLAPSQQEVMDPSVGYSPNCLPTAGSGGAHAQRGAGAPHEMDIRRF